MSKQTPIYQEALGIATGDIITTSYNSGPYRVYSIWGPKLWHADYHHIVIWPYPVISLTLDYIDSDLRGHAYINHIRRHGDRWLTNNDEVFVTKTQLPAQIPLIASDPDPEAETYPFQDGIDYHTGDGHVWHCTECGMDFNTQATEWAHPPFCPAGCGFVGRPIIMMGDNRQLDFVASPQVRATNAMMRKGK